MTLRIGILIAIDVSFVVGLTILLFLGHGQNLLAIIACIALIAYVTYAIVQLRAKAKAPK